MKISIVPLAILLCAQAAGAENAVHLTDFKLTGDLTSPGAAFTLTATAHVEKEKGKSASLDVLAGAVALASWKVHPHEHMRAANDHFYLDFDRSGDFPVQLRFIAAVHQREGWNRLDFHVAPSVLQPVVLRGLSTNTQFQVDGAARPERRGAGFTTFLPADGTVDLAWKEAATEGGGRLFFSASLISQVTVSPGLMQQTAVLDYKVMQGELSRLAVRLHGPGEVTRVQGDQVWSWKIESITNSDDRRLVVQLNQPQQDQFSIQIQGQTPLGAFPQTADVWQLQPEGVTRSAGYLRLVNEGAVRLEVVQSAGLSQISPEQFPESAVTRNAFHRAGNQVFAYRLAGTDFSLRLQADQIQPELSVSETLTYHLGESELALDAGLELDIREAPLRELVMDVPAGYAVAKLNAAGLSDYFLTGSTNAQLRLVFGQPISGRQLIELRLERNTGLSGPEWNLPRLAVPQAKSTRGFAGVATEAGWRATAERTRGVTEIATAFYPEKIEGLQTAFRLIDANWTAALRIERLPQTVQVSALHLFSIGEGVAGGSSILNYVISGAPVASFKINLSGEYDNVEFTGRDLRNWQKTSQGYTVQLQTPVMGAYTLLATYERPFKAQGESLAFTGAQPLDVQSEEGYTLVTSASQFDVQRVEVSPSLLPLEPGEVPAEYRLFSDAPILAAYRYAARPFDLKLALHPLAQGDSLNQIVDRALLDTRISKEGQVLTSARYFIKNRGNPHFRLTVPAGVQLWSATVNGASTVPVQDGAASLIPLPQSSDPNAVLELDIKLASQSAHPTPLPIAAPIVAAPVLLAEWKVEPDAGQRLKFQSGPVRPITEEADRSGFAQLARLFRGPDAVGAWTLLGIMAALVGSAILVCRRVPNRTGAVAAIFLLAVAGVVIVEWCNLVRGTGVESPVGLAFSVPVQPAGTALSVTVENVAEKTSVTGDAAVIWPALLAVVVLAAGFRWASASRVVAAILMAWAALRMPNGAPWLGAVAGIWLVLTMLPLIRARLGRSSAAGLRVAPAALGLALILAAAHSARAAQVDAVPDSVSHILRVDEKFVSGTAKIRWTAQRGDILPLLETPAVLTRIVLPGRALKLEENPGPSPFTRRLVAQTGGVFDIQIDYQMPVTREKSETGFHLPVPYGLVNRAEVTVADLDVDVRSSQAVSIQTEHPASNTVSALVLSPAPATISWRPRRRDLRHEKPVFYAEMTQLYVPLPGVIEGAHEAVIRPAQGELDEILFDVPAGSTVTDVLDPKGQGRAGASVVSTWRFDPDAGKLRVTLSSPQSRLFTILVRSQSPAGALPFSAAAGLLSVENAAGQQIGLAGIATGREVQLDTVTPRGLSPINLEDFPNGPAAALNNEVAALTLRRAFRYAGTNASLALRATAVEPDVRVESDDTLSLGEDRVVLADNFVADISRAGIFELSFLLPAGFDLETVSSPVLSQWTELKTAAGRVITLHLTGKTLGPQTFALTLAGPGLKTAQHWSVPQIILREASKQQGSLLVVPEQGMRVQVAERDGYTQLDPQKSGVKQKGVLGFRALQTPARLTLDIAQVDPWIQVTSLQHAEVSEAQIKVIANLEYQIENTGLKSFRVLLPEEAGGMRFSGAQVADYAVTEGAPVHGLRAWEVKLQRRMIGAYLLQAAYEIPLAAGAGGAVLRGVQAGDANLQRGFVTVQSDPRLQISINPVPEALQPTEWQGIPRVLQKDLQKAAANFTYRLVESDFALPLKWQRHEAARLLPARVNSIDLQSVAADDGAMLTRTRLEIIPGGKRLLEVTLPPGAKFWFAFVNDSGVWPWRNGDRFLIPLEHGSTGDRAVTVEFFHSSPPGRAEARTLDLNASAPKFDLPLENITWKVALGARWRVQAPSGTLQFQGVESANPDATVDAQSYLNHESSLQGERTAEAQQYLAAANHSLENRDSQQARRAFAAAFQLSTHDAAFNEDARVQLHNLKLQQALIGLNARQSAATGDAGALGGKMRALRDRGEANYTQQDAKDIIDINTAEENATDLRLAEKLIQQQDAATTSPAGIRATLPVDGRVLVFHRAVAVEPWADLNLELRATAVEGGSTAGRWVAMAVIAALLAGVAWLARKARLA